MHLFVSFIVLFYAQLNMIFVLFSGLPFYYLSSWVFCTADPPAYSRNKIMEARAKAIQEGNVEYLTSGALDDPFSNSEKQASKWRSLQTALVPTNTTERQMELKEMYSKLEEELQPSSESGDNSSQKDDEAILPEQSTAREDKEEQDTRKPAAASKKPQQQQLVVHAGSNIDVVVANGWKEAYPNKNGKPIILPDHSTAEERLDPTGLTEGTLNTVEWKAEMPESMESEFDSIFRSDEEELQKEAIFNKINKEYLVQQERKESERLNAEAAEKNLEDDDVKQAEQHARYQNSRSSRSKSGKHGNKRSSLANGTDTNNNNSNSHAVGLDGTTEEHLLAAMNNRKISRKINYDALSSIFDDDGSLGNVDASIASGDGDDMYAMI
jgi:Brf1-like TBP-binding domain